MKGYGSKGFNNNTIELRAIHRNKIVAKILIKRQLPPKSASLSG
jgi:hypothetical protein